ncbi:MAG: glycosyltransferase, partial [Planctomycetaceae bacterium]
SERIDVLYDRTYLMTLLAAAAARRRPVPRISVAVADPEPELRMHARCCTGWNWRHARRAYREAGVVVANSNGLRRRLIEYFQLDDHQVRTIHNMLDLEQLDRRAEEPAPAWDRDLFHIVSAGRLDERKGYEYLLEAIDRLVHGRGLTRIQLHVFGEGPSKSQLEQFIHSRRLERHVTLEGFRANPLPCFRHAGLFCLPSLNEGLPNALIEAVACGVPVLATDCPSGPAEILDGGRHGALVPPADAEALAAAIADAAANPERWRARTEAARRHVEALCSVRANMPRWEDLFEQAATGAPLTV